MRRKAASTGRDSAGWAGYGLIVAGMAAAATPWAAPVAVWLWHRPAALALVAAFLLAVTGIGVLHRRASVREQERETRLGPDAPPGRPWILTTWFIIGVMLLGFAASVTTALVLLDWVHASRLPESARITARFDVFKIASGIALGTGGLLALYLTFRRQRTAEADLWLRDRAQRHIERDALHQRLAEQYGQAITQLGSPAAHVRLAGLLALEHLAQDNAVRRQTVIDVFCGYLRMPYAPAVQDEDAEELGTRLEERQVRGAAQQIIRRHLKHGTPAKPDIPETFWPDMDLDLTGATLIDFTLAHCQVSNATFENAHFLRKTRFDGAVFTGIARFDRSTFARQATLIDTRFGGLTRFDDGTFNGDVDFTMARFTFTERGTANPWFTRTTFHRAADFTLARFSSNPDFRDVQFGGTQPVFTKTEFERGFPPELDEHITNTGSSENPFTAT